MEMEMEMEAEGERRSDRKGDDGGKMAATGKGSSSGAMARRGPRKGGGGGVLGKRRDTTRSQDVEKDPSEKEEEESKSLLPKEAVKIEKKKSERHVVVDEEFLEIVGMSAEEWAEYVADEVLPKKKETMEEWEARKEKEDKADREEVGSDYEAWKATKYRQYWNYVWSGKHGSFEDTTRIPAMRFTHKPALDCSSGATPTLQVFSVKVEATSGGLQWPLDVFGIVAMRDDLDRNRNIVFHRTRDNCQTLTEQDRNLVLVGPSRAVAVSTPEPVTIEVELKVKGITESEDKDFSFLAVPIVCQNTYYSRVFESGSHTSKLSTLEFRLGYVVFSVEATIFVQVIHGSWPDGFRGEFAAFTTGVCGNFMANAGSIDHEKIVLLDSRGEKVAVTADGKIKLSRCVVSVESMAELKVSVRAWKADNNVVENVNVFTALKAGVSDTTLDIGFCKVEISVAWSLISQYPVSAHSVL